MDWDSSSTYLHRFLRKSILLRAKKQKWQNFSRPNVGNWHTWLRHGCHRRTLVASTNRSTTHLSLTKTWMCRLELQKATWNLSLITKMNTLNENASVENKLHWQQYHNMNDPMRKVTSADVLLGRAPLQIELSSILFSLESYSMHVTDFMSDISTFCLIAMQVCKSQRVRESIKIKCNCSMKPSNFKTVECNFLALNRI